MKIYTFIIQIFAIAILSWLIGLVAPWWSFVIIAFLSGIIAYRHGTYSFWAGLLGVGIYYLTISSISSRGDRFAFVNQIGEVLSTGMEKPISGIFLLWIGTIIFGILGGLFALSGSLIISNEPSNKIGSGRAKTKVKGLKLDLKRFQ
ncbi:MAG: hypothetical protein M9958_04890 [Chitinophagales bacterium]|nr:hypothetical protein [Chitinophagales bacterium]